MLNAGAACPAGRSTASTRCSPIRRCSTCEAAAEVEHPKLGQLPHRQPGGEAVAHAGQRSPPRRRRSASTPTRSCASCGTRRRRNRRSAQARRGLSESQDHRVRKEGAVGWLIFSNPAKRNAMSVDMWEAIPPVLERFAADRADPRRRPGRRGRQGLRLGRRHLAVRDPALGSRGGAALRGDLRGRAGEARGVRQADGGDGARLLPGRGRQHRQRLRPAHRRRRRALRHSGGAHGPGLPRLVAEEPGRRGRSRQRAGDHAHRAPVHRRRGEGHRARPPGGAGCRFSRVGHANTATTSRPTRRSPCARRSASSAS